MTEPGVIAVVVNGDDFGLCPEVNQAVATCFEVGLISSATLLANAGGLGQACQLARSSDWGRRVGVHLNFSDGPALSAQMRQVEAFCDGEGRFARGPRRPAYLSRKARAAVARETAAQIARCREEGLEPTHADSHHHFHTGPFLIGAVLTAVRDRRVPGLRLTRNLSARSRRGVKGLYKRWLNRRIAAQGLARTDYFCDLTEFAAARERGPLPAATYEVMVHPRFDTAGRLVDAVDGALLADRLRRALSGCCLIPYPGPDR